MRAVCLLLLLTYCSFASAQTPQTPRSSKQDFSPIRQQLLAHVGNDDVPGLAIAVSKGGKILWEEGFGWADRERQIPASPQTLFYIASITKSFTATAVMHLAERGRLRLDDPVNAYLGAKKVHSPVWNASEATIRRMLSHTSGLTTFTRWCGAADDPNCSIDNEIERYGVLVWPPGEVFDYSNLGYGILGHVVSRVSTESFDSYLRTAILQPLNMRNCALGPAGQTAKLAAAQYDQKTHVRSPLKVSGHEGASGLHCSAHDLLSFGSLHLKEHLGSSLPLSSRDIDELHSAQPGTRGQYGLGWWIRSQSGVEIITAQGGTTNAFALLELIPQKDIAIVVVANSYSQLVSGLDRQIISVLLPGLPSDGQPDGPSQAVASTATAALTGKWSGQMLTYSGPVNVTIEIGGDGSARGQLADGPASTVTNISLSPTHFYGQLQGERTLPDSPDRPFTIEVDLALQGTKLIGAATFGPPQGTEGDQLPHFVNLTRN